jgi:hypothetical protein
LVNAYFERGRSFCMLVVRNRGWMGKNTILAAERHRVAIRGCCRSYDQRFGAVFSARRRLRIEGCDGMLFLRGGRPRRRRERHDVMHDNHRVRMRSRRWLLRCADGEDQNSRRRQGRTPLPNVSELRPTNGGFPNIGFPALLVPRLKGDCHHTLDFAFAAKIGETASAGGKMSAIGLTFGIAGFS